MSEHVEEDSNASGDGLSSEGAVASGSQSQSLLNSVFLFLSDAKPSVLVAFAGGVAAILYLIFGKLSLFFIGIASGVVLHAWWDELEHAGDSSTEESTKRKRRETSMEVANRLLDWKKLRTRKSLMSDMRGGPPPLPRDYSSFEAKTATALTRFTDAIIDSYVL